MKQRWNPPQLHLIAQKKDNNRDVLYFFLHSKFRLEHFIPSNAPPFPSIPPSPTPPLPARWD
ncbi:hypothetical protein E2C01_096611 [Portunus trituberculatus]|uniref:Uncharacterized protein n=1 Tax=Portunus trituberculatus TaxID=210409 RepID=A0A5B7K7P3_PORTR|nr:hypothetical protein [Portunus trituberculatus]